MGHKTRIMYIEHKENGIVGNARIGRVTFSKTYKTIYYKGQTFSKYDGFKSNYMDYETGEEYWISGCRKDGMDPLYSNQVEIDDDVWEEYWITIRNKPEMLKAKKVNLTPKYAK